MNVKDHEPRELVPFLQHYLKDMIYGANDGVITTFAVVAGVAGAALETRVALILGLANLLADGFSMGASNFLAIRSEEATRRSRGVELVEPFPVRHGTATFASFIVAGAVPLASFLVGQPANAFFIATVLTAVTLFVIGGSRAMISDVTWIAGALEMFLVGAAAACVAYVAGALVSPLVG